MKRKKKIAKIKAKADMSTMRHFRKQRVNPLGWNDKLHCQKCRRQIPDNRYHDKCQVCYFEDNDVTLKRY